MIVSASNNDAESVEAGPAAFHLEVALPYTAVMDKWKAGTLRSGSKSGPPVDSQKQAVAIMLSEKRAADEGKQEYKAPRRKLKG